MTKPPAATAVPSDASPAKMVKDASLPMYRQLCDQLTLEISNRKLAPGYRLPGEHGMCELYGVSRTVVRQALGQLEHDGVIERVKGKGTFVAPRKVSESLVHTLRGLYADVESRGGSIYSDVRRREVVPADDTVAEALRIPAGGPVVVLERLRYVEDSPWSLTTTYLPGDMAEVVLGADLRNQSLYAVLARNGIRAHHGIRSVEATVANKTQAEALGIVKGAPLMQLRSIVYDAADRPLEFFIAHHRGDQSRFEVVIDAASAGSGTAGFHRVTTG
ncbi:GntR family transcriptional regulator [Arthrobacter sp. UYCu723]